ncbi:hypothetical protein MOQ_003467 [Trypanosoma cruzi marinkellei]|uniref:Uncharacterized protein n=1 Tax=Trypanosoma cruzi marinkellei TaxID=85056 RepID=K2MBX5_TRYCR|nr:hypothetical protein MOQ_003467 [Trypanosoma cruzi marinkellei]
MKQSGVSYNVQQLLNSLVNDKKSADSVSNALDSLAVSQTKFVVRRLREGISGGALTIYLVGIEGAVVPLPLVPQNYQSRAGKIRDFVKWCFPDSLRLCGVMRKAAEHLPALREALDAPKIDRDRVCTLFTDHICEIEATKGVRPLYYTELMDVIMESSFERGIFRSYIFQDAAMAIKEWGARGQTRTRVAIWSLCPIGVTKALLRHSDYGDLTHYVVEYFDPSVVGSALELSTYMSIRRQLEKHFAPFVSDINIVFITSSSNGAVAANASNAMDATFLSMRPFNEPLTLDTLHGIDIATVSSFYQLRGGSVSYPLLCAEAREYMDSAAHLKAIKEEERLELEKKMRKT